MRRHPDLATGVRLALPLTLGTALGALFGAGLPTTLGADSPSTLVIASLTLVVTALVSVGSLVAVLPALSPAYPLTRAAGSSTPRPGRVTDPVHHPIRPRAPGV